MSSDIPPAVPSAPALPAEDRTVAVLSYITIIGFIVAIVIHNGKKTALGAYHLRQTLGLLVTGLAAWFALMVVAFIPVLNLLNLVLMPVLWLGLFILWVLGLIAAASGQQKPVPVIGLHYQKWFAGTFA